MTQSGYFEPTSSCPIISRAECLTNRQTQRAETLDHQSRHGHRQVVRRAEIARPVNKGKGVNQRVMHGSRSSRHEWKHISIAESERRSEALLFRRGAVRLRRENAPQSVSQNRFPAQSLSVAGNGNRIRSRRSQFCAGSYSARAD